MKKENILNILRDSMENKDWLIVHNLIVKLEKDIREETSYKSNSKSKISAIKKICKYSEKLRPVLAGYNIADDGKYEITDSYRAFRLNKMDMPVLRVGLEKTEDEIVNDIQIINGVYPNLKNILPTFNDDEIVSLNFDDVLYAYKTRSKDDSKNLYNLKSKSYSVYVDIVYLKETLDILGKDLKCSLNGEHRPVLFQNKEQEQGLIMPVKKY